MDTSDFAKRLADKLIEQLKAGTAPWQQPWAEGQSFSPYNPTTGNRYRGINVLALLVVLESDKPKVISLRSFIRKFQLNCPVHTLSSRYCVPLNTVITG